MTVGDLRKFLADNPDLPDSAPVLKRSLGRSFFPWFGTFRRVTVLKQTGSLMYFEDRGEDEPGRFRCDAVLMGE